MNQSRYKYFQVSVPQCVRACVCGGEMMEPSTPARCAGRIAHDTQQKSGKAESEETVWQRVEQVTEFLLISKYVEKNSSSLKTDFNKD